MREILLKSKGHEYIWVRNEIQPKPYNGIILGHLECKNCGVSLMDEPSHRCKRRKKWLK